MHSNLSAKSSTEKLDSHKVIKNNITIYNILCKNQQLQFLMDTVNSFLWMRGWELPGNRRIQYDVLHAVQTAITDKKCTNQFDTNHTSANQNHFFWNPVQRQSTSGWYYYFLINLQGNNEMKVKNIFLLVK